MQTAAKTLLRFDLHTHTRASDGLLSPGELVALARRHELAGIAVTDHDTVDGLEEALAAGEEEDYPVVPGVELTTDYGRFEVHILAYFIDHRHPELRARLAEVAAGRLARAEEMVAKLNALGYPLSWEAVKARANGPYIGRPHLVRALVETGIIPPEKADDFFRAYLVPGAPAYVPHKELATEEAVRLALAAGGVPVLAHPGRMGNPAVLPELVALGLVGLETDYPLHSPQEAAFYRRLALAYGLVPTGGSDFHGDPAGPSLGRATCGRESVLALVRRARGAVARAFPAKLHIPAEYWE
ncbi:MAG: PHP domain-containing protein [Bacillota bacterium]